MTARLRVLALLVRPAALLAMLLFALAGLAQGGAGDDPAATVPALAAVAAYLLCCVAVNDLADEAVDRVNQPARPLPAGSAGRRDLTTVAVTAGVLALGAAAWVGPWAVVVVAAGLVVGVGYSVPPVRLAARGAVASVVLPAAYVAVPFLVGLLAARERVTGRDALLLAGLYVGFVGRILLKDFRDARGDALFGKRTFLVRHGRVPTCAVSAVCWVLGLSALAAVRARTPEVVAAYVLFAAVALVLLRALADDRGPRRDEALVAATAIVGRAAVLTLVAHLTMVDAGWAAWPYRGVLAALVVVPLGQAAGMARRGPTSPLRVPSAWPRQSGAVPAASSAQPTAAATSATG